MERKFKIIYVIIAVVVVFAIAGIIIFLTSGKKYDKTIFMGNTTKITIDGQKITVSNNDEKIRKQKVHRVAHKDVRTMIEMNTEIVCKSKGRHNCKCVAHH